MRACSKMQPRSRETVCKAIGSSEQVHVVDALAITGDEGRGSLRKAAGSWQTSFDPQISEWGNPPLHRWLSGERFVGAISGDKSRADANAGL